MSMRTAGRRRRGVAIALALCALTAFLSGSRPHRRELRVCADPNNLPFSNARRQGFENRLADLLGAELHAKPTYTWWAQRRGFFRNTLRAGLCDVVLGVPADLDAVLATRPYYRSTYIFVSRAGSGFDVRSLDDPLLRRARIGVHLVGDDYANPPPVHALARRGIIRNVVGYSIYGDYRQPNPPARLLDAVARGEIDVAIVWGPFAGYFGPRTGVPLRITPVIPEQDGPALPFVFDIAAGVRRGDVALRRELQAALDRHKADIRRLLDDYGVPVPSPARSR